MKSRNRMRLITALVAVGLTAAVPGIAPAEECYVSNQLVAIPAYWSPNTPDGMAMFNRLAQNGPTNDLVVINGSQSMPETPYNSAWATAIKKVHDSGRKALTYVDTGYYGFDFGPGAHPTRGGSTATADWTAQIKADIDGWYALYGSSGVDGIFLDQTISTCGANDIYVDLYAAISDYISAHHPEAYIVINPGESPEQCYADIADTIMSMERDMDTYMNHYTPAAWQLNYPNPKKFWHAVYATPTPADMQTVIARTKANNAGYVYVTDRPLIPFPWDTLASYWDAELLAASGIADTTAPTAPSSLAVTARSGSTTARAYLTWKTPTDNVAVRDYEVFRNGVSLGRTYNNAYKATNLLPSTNYSFTVKATDVAGNVSAASAPKLVTTPPVGASLASPSACLSPTVAKYGVTYNEEFSHHRVFINSDNNIGTGYNLPPGQPQGVDYLIENGLLYHYVGPDWNWSQVTGVAPLTSDTNDIYAWQVPTSALTGAATTQVVAFSGFDQSGSIPEAYSTTLTVNQTATC